MVQFGYESFDWHRYLVLLAVLVGPVRGQHAIVDIVHFRFLAIALNLVPVMLSENVEIFIVKFCWAYMEHQWNIPLNFVDVKLPYGDCL